MHTLTHIHTLTHTRTHSLAFILSSLRASFQLRDPSFQDCCVNGSHAEQPLEVGCWKGQDQMLLKIETDTVLDSSTDFFSLRFHTSSPYRLGIVFVSESRKTDNSGLRRSRAYFLLYDEKYEDIHPRISKLARRGSGLALALSLLSCWCGSQQDLPETAAPTATFPPGGRCTGQDGVSPHGGLSEASPKAPQHPLLCL